MRRVVILGNTWHGNWSLSLFEELKKQKENVIHINVIPYHFKTGLFFLDNLVRKLFLWRINKIVVQKVSIGDTVIVITPYTLRKKTFTNLKKKNTHLIAWLGDDPFRKGKASMYLPFFKKIFIVDESWEQSIKVLNPRVETLPHAFQEDTFFSFNIVEKLYPVSFVGDSFGGTGEGMYRASLLKALNATNVPVALFGDKGWLNISNKNPEYRFLASIYKGPITKPEDLNTVYNNSEIILNIHHRQVKNGANQRIFEASGAGAFQISDKQKLVEDLFSDSIEHYENTHELIEKVQYYLLHKDEAKQKAQKAWTLAKSHTYNQRMEKLLNSK